MPEQLILQFEALITTIIISVVASFVRLMFYRDLTFWRTVSNFFGGVALGMLIGYLLRNNTTLGIWRDILVAGIALLGKELTTGLVKIAPEIVPMFGEYLRSLLHNFVNNNKKEK